LLRRRAERQQVERALREQAKWARAEIRWVKIGILVALATAVGGAAVTAAYELWQAGSDRERALRIDVQPADGAALVDEGFAVWFPQDPVSVASVLNGLGSPLAGDQRVSDRRPTCRNYCMVFARRGWHPTHEGPCRSHGGWKRVSDRLE
jgi:hypothetical protein